MRFAAIFAIATVAALVATFFLPNKFSPYHNHLYLHRPLGGRHLTHRAAQPLGPDQQAGGGTWTGRDPEYFGKVSTSLVPRKKLKLYPFETINHCTDPPPLTGFLEPSLIFHLLY